MQHYSQLKLENELVTCDDTYGDFVLSVKAITMNSGYVQSEVDPLRNRSHPPIWRGPMGGADGYRGAASVQKELVRELMGVVYLQHR